ncbi:hypothetical protein KIW84_043830 [Lathyrus oleraceus]|uniref:Uncharacterized protein n=1 Tax=Pisum sativum TaxID=3888 RepID=A0A9D4XJ25_PEA|nr:hypothetical protein KIW84_043830 [Pisum sativum]
MLLADFLVGLNERVDNVMDLLQLQSNIVKVLGLYGMGGVCKTTLAKALFNSLVGRFERRCFVSNVRHSSSKEDGLLSLQTNIIKDLSSEEGTQSFMGDVNAGISTIRNIVRENRVLLVLDDVDSVNQLDYLIGKREWFCKGSCIIITSRDTAALPEKHVNELYEVKELYDEEALQLFSYHALRKKDPPPSFLKFSEEIVSLTGCFLCERRRVEEWEDAIEKLRTIRPGNLHDVLKISYDGLDEQEKCIFFDIACFFLQMEMKRGDVIDILRGCGFRGEIAMTILVQKCLIKIRHDNTLWMHDQIRDMGRQIVMDENHVDPGMRSRLWDHAEIVSVLKSNKVPENLMVINLSGCFQLAEIPDLSWCLRLEKIILDNCINLKKIHESIGSLTTLHNLNLRRCINITELPSDVSGLKHLEILVLSSCTELKALPKRIGLLKSLKTLEADDTAILTELLAYNSGIKELPSTICSLSYLRMLSVGNCKHLSKLPDSIKTLASVTELKLDGTPIRYLPDQIGDMKQLRKLDIGNCSNLESLPESIGHLGSLTTLNIDNGNIKELPTSIGLLEYLVTLTLNKCRMLKKLPTSIGNLKSLNHLMMEETAMSDLPESFGMLANLKSLRIAKRPTLVPISGEKMALL